MELLVFVYPLNSLADIICPPLAISVGEAAVPSGKTGSGLMIRMSWRTGACLFAAITMVVSAGCRNHQHARILSQTDEDMVGSHEAGAETWKPLIEESVAKLLARSFDRVETVSYTRPDGIPVRTVCFVGVENRSSEPLGDFREQIYEHIDSLIGTAPNFRMISRRYVEGAMKEIRCRPDELVVDEKQRQLQMVLEREDQVFDYLLFASVTSGTTEVNGDYQRNYQLILELLDIHSGVSLKESALLRKGYHQSYLGKIKHQVTGNR